ncbi:unnamed protein product [Cylindrotheca closterium]|uniref:Hexosyltransferase n=1 Tax=Cylindrotheca closterium TaxID=2856 RepID=A0AAD2G0A1_9STRA|nr:unnamed protein product [Cylindrotheca closterium]
MVSLILGAVVLSIKVSVQLTGNQSFVLQSQATNAIPQSLDAPDWFQSGAVSDNMAEDLTATPSISKKTLNSPAETGARPNLSDPSDRSQNASPVATLIIDPTKTPSNEKSTLSLPAHPFVGPKFLVGIMCVQEDVERRQFIRDSFVSFYKDTEDFNSNRICSLNDLLNEEIDATSCQIAYIFLAGGLTEGSTQLLTPNATHPITIETPDEYGGEDDVAFLNIKENMNDGKTPTFYRYASLALDRLKERQISFDFVMKIDLDTMLFPVNLLEYAANHFPLHLKQVYMGRKVRGGKSGYSWAAGPFQILSVDLAKAISGPESIGRQNRSEFEDKEISKRVEYLGTNASKIWLPDKTLMIQPSKISHGKPKYANYNFTEVLYGHTEWGNKGRWSRFSPGPYFKYLPTARKIWRHYLYWHTHNKTSVSNTYHLFDMPPRGDILTLVRRNDYIFSNQDFDSSPVVLEDYKLVFFPIEGNGAETWRCLFRRMLKKTDWRNETVQFQGLALLSDFTLERANEIMTSAEYTRAMIVQDPKTRLLSSYVRKVLQDRKNEFMKAHCCGTIKQLVLPGSEHYVGKCAKMEEPISFEMFVNITQDCDHPYWRPQSRKMEPKYFPYINYVGHYETIEKDAKVLLQKIGAWDKFGRDGWGTDGTEPIFALHTNWTPLSVSKLLQQDYGGVLATVGKNGSVFQSDYQWSLMNS